MKGPDGRPVMVHFAWLTQTLRPLETITVEDLGDYRSVDRQRWPSFLTLVPLERFDVTCDGFHRRLGSRLYEVTWVRRGTAVVIRRVDRCNVDLESDRI